MPNLTTFSRSSWLATVIRAMVVSLILSLGVVGVALLADSQRASKGQLELLNFSARYLEDVAMQSFVALLVGFVVAEKLGQVLVGRGCTWRLAVIAISTVFAVFAGVFVCWLVFDSLPQSWPLFLMVAAGGAWVGYAGVGLQFALWQLANGPEETLSDFPRLWYTGLVAIIAVFFGGLHASISIDRQFEQVIRYRREHWADRPREPLEPGEGILDEMPMQ